QELRQRVAAEGVDISQVDETEKAETGAALVMIDPSGEKEILAFSGANACISIAQVERARAVISTAKVLLLQFEAPIETVVAAARVAREAGVKIVLDPAPAITMPGELLPLLHAVRPNAHEAEALTGARVYDRESALRAARQLQQKGIQIVGTQAG